MSSKPALSLLWQVFREAHAENKLNSKVLWYHESSKISGTFISQLEDLLFNFHNDVDYFNPKEYSLILVTLELILSHNKYGKIEYFHHKFAFFFEWLLIVIVDPNIFIVTRLSALRLLSILPTHVSWQNDKTVIQYFIKGMKLGMKISLETSSSTSTSQEQLSAVSSLVLSSFSILKALGTKKITSVIKSANPGQDDNNSSTQVICLWPDRNVVHESMQYLTSSLHYLVNEPRIFARPEEEQDFGKIIISSIKLYLFLGELRRESFVPLTDEEADLLKKKKIPTYKGRKTAAVLERYALGSKEKKFTATHIPIPSAADEILPTTDLHPRHFLKGLFLFTLTLVNIIRKMPVVHDSYVEALDYTLEILLSVDFLPWSPEEGVPDLDTSHGVEIIQYVLHEINCFKIRTDLDLKRLELMMQCVDVVYKHYKDHVVCQTDYNVPRKIFLCVASSQESIKALFAECKRQIARADIEALPAPASGIKLTAAQKKEREKRSMSTISNPYDLGSEERDSITEGMLAQDMRDSITLKTFVSTMSKSKLKAFKSGMKEYRDACIVVCKRIFKIWFAETAILFFQKRLHRHVFTSICTVSLGTPVLFSAVFAKVLEHQDFLRRKRKFLLRKKAEKQQLELQKSTPGGQVGSLREMAKQKRKKMRIFADEDDIDDEEDDAVDEEEEFGLEREVVTVEHINRVISFLVYNLESSISKIPKSSFEYSVEVIETVSILCDLNFHHFLQKLHSQLHLKDDPTDAALYDDGEDDGGGGRISTIMAEYFDFDTGPTEMYDDDNDYGALALTSRTIDFPAMLVQSYIQGPKAITSLKVDITDKVQAQITEWKSTVLQCLVRLLELYKRNKRDSGNSHTQHDLPGTEYITAAIFASNPTAPASSGSNGTIENELRLTRTFKVNLLNILSEEVTSLYRNLLRRHHGVSNEPDQPEADDAPGDMNAAMSVEDVVQILGIGLEVLRMYIEVDKIWMFHYIYANIIKPTQGLHSVPEILQKLEANNMNLRHLFKQIGHSNTDNGLNDDYKDDGGNGRIDVFMFLNILNLSSKAISRAKVFDDDLALFYGEMSYIYQVVHFLLILFYPETNQNVLVLPDSVVSPPNRSLALMTQEPAPESERREPTPRIDPENVPADSARVLTRAAGQNPAEARTLTSGKLAAGLLASLNANAEARAKEDSSKGASDKQAAASVGQTATVSISTTATGGLRAESPAKSGAVPSQPPLQKAPLVDPLVAEQAAIEAEIKASIPKLINASIKENKTALLLAGTRRWSSTMYIEIGSSDVPVLVNHMIRGVIHASLTSVIMNVYDVFVSTQKLIEREKQKWMDKRAKSTHWKIKNNADKAVEAPANSVHDGVIKACEETLIQFFEAINQCTPTEVVLEPGLLVDANTFKQALVDSLRIRTKPEENVIKKKKIPIILENEPEPESEREEYDEESEYSSEYQYTTHIATGMI